MITDRQSPDNNGQCQQCGRPAPTGRACHVTHHTPDEIFYLLTQSGWFSQVPAEQCIESWAWEPRGKNPGWHVIETTAELPFDQWCDLHTRYPAPDPFLKQSIAKRREVLFDVDFDHRWKEKEELEWMRLSPLRRKITTLKTRVVEVVLISFGTVASLVLLVLVATIVLIYLYGWAMWGLSIQYRWGN
jgi:hypothetical protein